MRNIKTADDIRNFQNAIRKNYRMLRGKDDGEDDCVQHIMKNYLEGKSQFQKIRHAVLDYLELKINSKENYIEKSEATFVLDLLGHNPTKNLHDKFHAETIVNLIENRLDRVMFMLYYKWGFHQREIGEVMNVAESFICKKLNIIEIDLKKKLKNLGAYE